MSASCLQEQGNKFFFSRIFTWHNLELTFYMVLQFTKVLCICLVIKKFVLLVTVNPSFFNFLFFTVTNMEFMA